MQIFVGIVRCVKKSHEIDAQKNLGIAHLDLSLENALMLFNGDVRLLDFGMAGIFSHEEQTHINVKGKPQPRYDGKWIGKAKSIPLAALQRKPFNAFLADLYALGAMLYQLAT